MHHEHFTRQCLDPAVMAREQGYTPVGSVVVLDGAIVGEGIETLPRGSPITGPTRILACRAAIDAAGRNDLSGPMPYTTAEPFVMCGSLIRQLRIGLVVYGMDTPVIGAVTSIHPILTDPALDGWRPAPAMIGGIRHVECERLRAR